MKIKTERFVVEGAGKRFVVGRWDAIEFAELKEGDIFRQSEICVVGVAIQDAKRTGDIEDGEPVYGVDAADVRGFERIEQ